ncbi:uncharacterized protein LOC141640425 [Silene latifolia]|uniref:uncharacterized protein LOC141640425 n=1 Tax=Silene latifolia TaxID=37657 RepID=UPI003D780640
MMFLHQKWKAQWIHQGDLNTEFFHKNIKKRNEQNAAETDTNDLISENQEVFVAGRNIVHNIMIRQDIFRKYNCNVRKSSPPKCLMKIDLTKPCDTIKWSFIQDMRSKPNFPTKFTQWMMEVITNYKSVFLILRAFATFRDPRDLSKPNIYTSNVVQSELQRLLQISGFQLEGYDFSICRSINFCQETLINWIYTIQERFSAVKLDDALYADGNSLLLVDYGNKSAKSLRL